MDADGDIKYCELSWNSFMAIFVPGVDAIPAAHAKKMPQLARGSARTTRNFVKTTVSIPLPLLQKHSS